MVGVLVGVGVGVGVGHNIQIPFGIALFVESILVKLLTCVPLLIQKILLGSISARITELLTDVQEHKSPSTPSNVYEKLGINEPP